MIIKTHLIHTPDTTPETTSILACIDGKLLGKKGWGNGYIGVPPEHPWFGKDYNSIKAKIHGGITWADERLPNSNPDGLWWIGFDTAHASDNKTNCSFGFVKQETKNLKQQAIKAYEEFLASNK